MSSKKSLLARPKGMTLLLLLLASLVKQQNAFTAIQQSPSTAFIINQKTCLPLRASTLPSSSSSSSLDIDFMHQMANLNVKVQQDTSWLFSSEFDEDQDDEEDDDEIDVDSNLPTLTLHWGHQEDDDDDEPVLDYDEYYNTNYNNNNKFHQDKNKKKKNPEWIEELYDASLQDGSWQPHYFNIDLVPLPDSIMNLTCFIGNLHPLVNEQHLSNLFGTLSSHSRVPATVVRKSNLLSSEYGFAYFDSMQQKEIAMMKFNGYKLLGKPIRVEPVLDHPKRNRVKAPESFVRYLCGELKRTPNGRVNTMRRVDYRPQMGGGSTKKQKKQRSPPKRCNPKQLKNTQDRHSLDRAIRRGYLDVLGINSYTPKLASRPLLQCHRQWCTNQHYKPQIIHCKAASGTNRPTIQPLDMLVVDMSLLKRKLLKHNIIDNNNNDSSNKKEKKNQRQEEQLVKLLSQVKTTANDCQMESCGKTITAATDWKEDEQMILQHHDGIFCFRGERANAKQMARQLVQLWNVKGNPIFADYNNNVGSTTTTTTTTSSYYHVNNNKKNNKGTASSTTTTTKRRNKDSKRPWQRQRRRQRRQKIQEEEEMAWALYYTASL